MTIDDEYIKTIKSNITCQPIEVAFIESDNDAFQKLMITCTINTVGASTPLKINTNAVFTFHLHENEIQFEDVTFEKIES